MPCWLGFLLFVAGVVLFVVWFEWAVQRHIRDYFAQRGRLNNVAFRIRVANHRDCKNRSAQIGLDAGTVPSLPRKHSFMRHCGELDKSNRIIGCRDLTGRRCRNQSRRPSPDIQQ